MSRTYHSLITVACILVMHLHLGQGDEKHPEVQTKSGKIRGKVLKLEDKREVAAFLGIPFAEPPVGELRFQDPVPRKFWNFTLDATEFGPLCVQGKKRVHWHLETEGDRKKLLFKDLANYTHDEDCLNMNIYTPLEALPKINNKPQNGLSVMFFIHGGSYKTNGGRFFPGERLASQGQVVVITVNYRLGVLGFLSTEDSSAKGNYGLKDQILALKWIKENIVFFGGTDDVTIFGNSAGGACVGLHLISPLSKGLFSKAIGQSGSAIGEWAVQRKPVKYAKRLANSVKCEDTTSSEVILKCLRNMSAELITEKSDDHSLKDSLMLQFAPTVDGEFLLAHPSEMFQQEGAVGSLPVMIGVTRHEFEDWMAKSADPTTKDLPPFTKDVLRKYLFHLVRKDYISDVAADVLLHVVYTEYVYKHGMTSSHHKKRRLQQQEMGNETGFYLENPVSFLPDMRTLAKIISDIDLKAPSVKLASLLSLHPGTSVYLYEFDYASKDDVFISNGTRDWVGSYHESELYYIFGFPHMNIDNALRLKEDKEVSDIMIQLWTDFAKTGNPTPRKSGQTSAFSNFTWFKYNEDEEFFATLGLQPFVARSYESERMAFWNYFIPLFTEYPFNTRTQSVTTNHSKCLTKEKLLYMLIICFSSILFITAACVCLSRSLRRFRMKLLPVIN